MKPIILIILILLLIPLSSAETIQSQYGKIGEILNIGDRLIAIHNPDNTVTYKVLHSSLFPATITNLKSKYDTNRICFSIIPITLEFGDYDLKHRIDIVNSLGNTVLSNEYQITTDKEVCEIIPISDKSKEEEFTALEYVQVVFDSEIKWSDWDIQYFSISPSSSISTTIEGTPIPSPTPEQTISINMPTGKLEIITDQTDLQVTLNDKPASLVVSNLPIGTYNIKVSKSGYTSFNRKITLTSSGDIINVHLFPISDNPSTYHDTSSNTFVPCPDGSYAKGSDKCSNSIPDVTIVSIISLILLAYYISRKKEI